jgi:hypothetical protein
MATQYEVNIAITSGADFHQSFFLANPDFSATDLTGCLVFGAVAKHSNAQDALKEGIKTTNAMMFTTSLPDPQSGHYAIQMSALDTDKMEEGKYVYSVVIQFPDDRLVEATSGLVFVSKAFGLIRNYEDDTSEPGTDVNPGPDPINPPGSGGGGGEGTDPGGNDVDPGPDPINPPGSGGDGGGEGTDPGDTFSTY